MTTFDLLTDTEKKRLANALADQQDEIRYQVKSAAWWRRFSHRYWLIKSPYLLVRFLWVGLLSWVSPSRATAKQIAFLRYYLGLFFKYRGVTSYCITQTEPDAPFPTSFSTSFTRPTVIFSNRSDYMKGLFCFTLFRTPVIVPLLREFFRLGLLPFWRFPSMAWLLKKISYPDGPLNRNMHNVSALLQHRYPVVVFLNEATEKADLGSALHINREVAALFKRPDIDVHILIEDGFDYFEFSSIRHPVLVRCSLVSREDVFPEFLTSPPDDAVIFQELGRLLGYQGVVVMDSGS